MQFGYIGINYKKADLEIRDNTSFTDSMKIDFMQCAEQFEIEQIMILSTCNRSEVYFFYENDEQITQLLNLSQKMFPLVSLNEYIMRLTRTEAIAYLFRIAAGLESLVLGEDQILGQVKEALDFSRTLGYSKKELSKVVRDAITCAKKIKTELKINDNPISVGYIGIKELEHKCGILGKKILIIGSGKTAELALTYITEYGAKEVFICNRTLSHAKRLITSFPEIKVVEYENRYQVVNDCDIIISATSAPHLVIRHDKIKYNEQCFLDLAAPRDIDVEVANQEGIELINLDDIKKIAEDNQRERIRLVELSQQLIEDAVKDTEEWLLVSHMDATIESLQQRCTEIVDDSFDYLNRKMDLSQHEQKLLQKILNASLQRLLREPIQELKKLDTKEEQEKYQEIVRNLFQI